MYNKNRIRQLRPLILDTESPLATNGGSRGGRGAIFDQFLHKRKK